MQSEYIINGITYRKVEPLVEEKRIEGFVDLKDYGNTWWAMSAFKTLTQKTRVIEIRQGEVIVSRDDIRKAWLGCINVHGTPYTQYEMFIKLLGFDKC